jgi:predicted kinase
MPPPLLCLVGLPASGKSTIVTAIQTDCPKLIVVSPDRIRADLYGDAAIQGDWAVIESMVAAQFCQAVNPTIAPSPVAIYDATNANPAHRIEAIALARRCGFGRVIGIWVDCPLALCLAHNQSRERQVPAAAIARMDAMLRSHPPQVADGYDRLIRLTPATPWPEFQRLVASWV